jgi:processing peptidase subunit alpha
MQTKLYREVLRKEGWIHGIECITAWYSDGGLVGLYASAPHEWTQHLLHVATHQMASIACRIDDSYVQMAKNQLLSQLVLLGESREQLLHDMGFNMVIHDHVTTAREMMEGTSAVNLAAIKRVCREMVEKPITLAVFGDTSKIPPHEQLEQHIRASFKKQNQP